ncbi:MAG: PAS domain S-box-containing protein [Algoriphagus sp.]|jgi:PAS domain S-box-containing protein
MDFFTNYRKGFFITLAIGTTLVFLIILLGVSFFNAIISTENSFKKEFLRKQTELASSRLELELNKFEESSTLLMNYLEGSDLDTEHYGEKLTEAVKRVFKYYPDLIDTVYVDLKDSTIFFTRTPRNDFIRKASLAKFLVLNPSRSVFVVQGKIQPFRIFFHLNPVAFTKDFVENFYIDPKGKKILYLNGEFWDLSMKKKFDLITVESQVPTRILADFKIGVLGVYESDWNFDGESKKGILTQYPFNFGSISDQAALVFIAESESIVPGIYNTYFLIYIGLIVLIIGTIILFALSLKSNLESQRLLSKNADEISELFDQQNLLLKELNGFVYFHDSQGKITRISDEVSEVLGLSKSEFIETFNHKLNQEDAVVIKSVVKKALKADKTYVDFEYDFISFENRKVRLRIFEKLVFDSSGNFIGGIGICKDITDQYESRQALIQSEDRLRTLIENIPDTLFIYDNEGYILDFKIKIAQFEMDLNMELIGKNLSEVIDAAQSENMVQGFKKASKTREIQTVKLKSSFTGEMKYYEVRFFPLDEDKVMSITKDVTAQRIWEKGLLEAMNVADKASKAKSEFLANMSHEIRTPMNGLLGIIDLLEQTELNETQREYIGIIKNSGNSLLGIIKDILDYSKIEAGKIDLYNSVFIPKMELQKHVLILSGLALKKKINLTIIFGLGTENTVEGDLEKLLQVFLNLIGNAIKFTPKNGSVQITIDIDPIAEELWQLKVSVKDSGIGIPDELIPYLTDPFYQVESSSSRTYQGTGLGLAISKRLIELMGGELAISSKLDEGSEFAFTALLKMVNVEQLKLKEVPATNPQSWIGMASEYPLRILLVEDNDLNLQLMNLMLAQLGYDFKVAKNGQKAVTLASEQIFDLILMDVQMPILNGLESTMLIRKMPHNTSIYIIGLSANVFDEDKKKAIESGMNDYLTKPIRLVELVEKLKDYATRLKS